MSSCPICDHTEKKKLGEKDDFEIFMCRRCRSIFAETINGAEAVWDYSDYYHDENLSAPDFVHTILGEVITGFASYRQNNRFLDVGCGAGTILEEAAKQGWDAEGLEMSPPAVEALRKRGFEIFCGTLNEASYPDNHFDVITASEVIEHVENPGEVLREMARILRPNGLLWMTTPHANGISTKTLGAHWSIIAPPEHLHLFSIKGLRGLLTDAGFNNCRFVTSGFNFMEVVRFYKSRPNSKEKNDAAAEPAFDRVATGYQLNQWLTSGRYKKKMKNALNSALNLTRLGDNLKVWASLEK
jgi:SAM-dependent methyltransferase